MPDSILLPSSVPGTQHRRSIYYWKCDRPAAFHGTLVHTNRGQGLQDEVQHLLEKHFSVPVIVRPAGGQGNHITYTATAGSRAFFVRIEDGPEQDNYLEVESRVQEEVRALGVPTPVVHAVDASRQHVPFAWQVMEWVRQPDLNQQLKNNQLDLGQAAQRIGAAAAQWQSLTPPGFGPFDPDAFQQQNRLQGFHESYSGYFFLHLERHLHFLGQHGFLTYHQCQEIEHEIIVHQSLLNLDQGCLVHKDLALWNILGSDDEIAAFIDWDDAISGDPMDDLSLLACFYDGHIIREALRGYQQVRPLPEEAALRFWLHLLRNMIVKSVIRIGAGYFDRSDSFFLINNGHDGNDLKSFTRQRLQEALLGLRENRAIAAFGAH